VAELEIIVDFTLPDFKDEFYITKMCAVRNTILLKSEFGRKTTKSGTNLPKIGIKHHF